MELKDYALYSGLCELFTMHGGFEIRYQDIFGQFIALLKCVNRLSPIMASNRQ